ncbi:MAG: class I SAM-dependent methyltransferase [Candidatus Nomurabacteria bacterium]|nr:class I SAM-dependent methyltransferase [Candidatus Nomurabacteria bacterium]
MENNIKILYSKDWVDYELIDTGEGEKLERFGKYVFVRPYEGAVWPKDNSIKEWNNIDGKFWSSKQGAKSGWKMKEEIKDKFELSYKGIKFLALPTPFRHLGFFPEQASHWDFIEEKIKNTKRPIKFLNLFGYTGIASLFALRAGADVTHVDASKQSLSWAKENEKASGITGLRIIPDDVLKFLEKEIKRGEKYDAIIMDPPKFGRGPKGETWKIEEMLPELLEKVKKVLSKEPLFIILNSYAIDSSSLSLAHALADTMKNFKGQTSAGELCILEKSKGRVIPLSNVAIWEN